MEIIGTCINCWSGSGTLAINACCALALLCVGAYKTR